MIKHPNLMAGYKFDTLDTSGVYFFGQENHVNITPIGIFGGGVPYSVSLWYNQFSSGGQQIFLQFSGDNHLYFGTGGTQPDNVPHLRGRSGGGWSDILVAPSHSYETWYHVVFTYSPVNGYKLYGNSNLVNSNTFTGVIDAVNQQSRMGNWYDGQFDYKGLLKEVCIYNTELDQAAVNELLEEQRW